MIGIMGAEAKEVEGILALFEDYETITLGMREYHHGVINGQEVVAVYSRCGKTAAATTVTALIHHFNIHELIFTGVAGALHPDLQIGDIVISQNLLQHDVDVRPFRKQFEIPILGITFFESDIGLQDKAKKAAEKSLTDPLEELQTFSINNPTVWIGDIASGDQFISSEQKKKELLSALPSVLCTEMEGAAVAQVCYEYKLPFVVIRTISDTANESAGIDFPLFLEQVASKYSAAIVAEMLKTDR